MPNTTKSVIGQNDLQDQIWKHEPRWLGDLNNRYRVLSNDAYSSALPGIARVDLKAMGRPATNVQLYVSIPIDELRTSWERDLAAEEISQTDPNDEEFDPVKM